MNIDPQYVVSIKGISVDYTRDWKAAVLLGAPDTENEEDWELPAHHIMKVGKVIQPERTGIATVDVILVLFHEESSVGPKKALGIARASGWGRPINRWECLAIAEHHPDLNRELPGFDNPFGFVYSLQKLTFYEETSFLNVFYDGGLRRASLVQKGGFHLGRMEWTGFVND